MTPEISVVMAVHNAQQFLPRAVRSILEQDFEDFEFIIVDDASTDSSPQILAGLEDPRLRLLHNQQNMGLTRSLNRALQAARGNLVARQDADDLSEPQRLGRQMAYMEEHPRTLVVGSWALEVNGRGQVTGEVRQPTRDPDIRWRLLFGNAFAHTSVVFRRLMPGGEPVSYEESLRYSQDYELWSRLGRQGRLANIPEHLVRLRRHAGQISAESADAQNESAHAVALANIRELTGQSPDSELMARLRKRSSPWGFCREAGYEGAKMALRLWAAYRQQFGGPPRGQIDLCAREMRDMLAVAFQHPCDQQGCADILLELAAYDGDRPWLTQYLGEYICERVGDVERLQGQIAHLSREVARLKAYEVSYNYIMNKPAVRAYRKVKGAVRELFGRGPGEPPLPGMEDDEP